MPKPLPELTLPIEEFKRLPHRLHHSWMARHFESIGDREAAAEHSLLADEFDAITQSIEASGQQFAIDPFVSREL